MIHDDFGPARRQHRQAVAGPLSLRRRAHLSGTWRPGIPSARGSCLPMAHNINESLLAGRRAFGGASSWRDVTITAGPGGNTCQSAQACDSNMSIKLGIYYEFCTVRTRPGPACEIQAASHCPQEQPDLPDHMDHQYRPVRPTKRCRAGQVWRRQAHDRCK